MKYTKKYVRSENRAKQFVKTAANKRSTYTYRYSEEEYTEKIELIPGEDGVTEEWIKQLHKLDDREVYYNIKANRPQRTPEEKQQIKEWKADFSRKFEAEHGYPPHQADVNAAADEAFPKNWNASLDEILDGDDDDNDGTGDKSAVLAMVYRSSESEPGFIEMADEIASTWSADWQEIYERVLKDGESIVSLAREKNVTEGAIRKKVKKIRERLAGNKELRKFVRFFDEGTN